MNIISLLKIDLTFKQNAVTNCQEVRQLNDIENIHTKKEKYERKNDENLKKKM